MERPLCKKKDGLVEWDTGDEGAIALPLISFVTSGKSHRARFLKVFRGLLPTEINRC